MTDKDPKAKRICALARCLEMYDALSPTNGYKKYRGGIREITNLAWVQLYELIRAIEKDEKNKVKKRKQ